MASAPNIAWTAVAIVGVCEWSMQPPMAGASPVSPITGLVHGDSPVAGFEVATWGTVAFTVTGDVTSGSNQIANVSPTADLVVGQQISGLGIPPGSVVSAISGSTVTFANGEFDESTDSWLSITPAVASGTGVALAVNDPAPIGSLIAAVSPSTGTTLADQNADSTGNVSHIGGGTSIANLAGQGEGGFSVEFTSAGTFDVSCSFVSSDTDYSGVAVTPVLSLVVS